MHEGVVSINASAMYTVFEGTKKEGEDSLSNSLFGAINTTHKEAKKGDIMDRKCAKCGALLEEDAMFCGECGEPWIEEDNDDILQNYGPIGALEELRITEDIQVKTGQTKIFKNNRLIFSAKIKAEEDAKLQFINCDISINESAFIDEWENKIKAIETNGAELVFDKCAFRNTKKGFIKAYSGIKSEDRITIQGCLIDSCDRILDAGFYGTISIRNSYIDLTSDNEMYGLAMCKNIEMYNTMICGRGERRESVYDIFEKYELLRLDKCHFSDIPNLCIGMSTDANDCSFEKCSIKINHVIGGGKYQYKGGGLFKNCQFKNCTFEKSYTDYVIRFESSRFLDCIGQLPTVYMKDAIMDGGFLVLWRDTAIKLLSCRFSNWSYRDYKDVKDSQGYNILLSLGTYEVVISAVHGSEISDCQFENMDLGNASLIGGSPYEYSSFRVENCHFRNISTGSAGILKRYRSYRKRGLFSNKLVTEEINIKVSNCSGL